MLEDLNTFLNGMDIEEFKTFLAKMKDEGKQLQKEHGSSEDYAPFFVAFMEAFEEELQGLHSFDNIDLKKKARIYAMFHLFNEMINMEDEDFDDFEEDFDQDDLEHEYKNEEKDH